MLALGVRAFLLMWLVVGWCLLGLKLESGPTRIGDRAERARSPRKSLLFGLLEASSAAEVGSCSVVEIERTNVYIV